MSLFSFCSYALVQGVFMPRKPHIEIAGYYHTIYRGVEQRIVLE